MAVLKLNLKHRSKKRKTLAAFLAVVLVLGIVGGVYAYRIVNAIVNVEKNAVIALPTRNIDFAWDGNQTPTQESSPASPTLPAAVDVESSGTVTPPDTSVVAETPVPPTEVPVGATPTKDPNRALPTSADPSHMSVIENLINAGVGSGDPGRSEVWDGLTGINILVLGVDRRPDGGDQNADVIIIAHVDLITKRVAGVSIPRDLLVEIPGVGPDKINSAYNVGYQSDPDNKVAGVAMMRDTIESVFQVPIHGYILVDFDGFTTVIDEIGGVTIDVPELLVDEEYPTDDFGIETVTFLPGIQQMNGERALKYVRTRHQDSDDGRRDRQLQVLRALFDRAKSFDSISNGYEIIMALGDSVQTSFGTEQQLTLARIGYGMADSDIDLAAMGSPLITGQTIETGAWVYVGDPVALREWVRVNLSTDSAVNPTPAVSSPVAGETASPYVPVVSTPIGQVQSTPGPIGSAVTTPAAVLSVLTPTPYIPGVPTATATVGF